jgi:hypothetical protein
MRDLIFPVTGRRGSHRETVHDYIFISIPNNAKKKNRSLIKYISDHIWLKINYEIVSKNKNYFKNRDGNSGILFKQSQVW